MVAAELQRELVAEIEDILKDIQFFTASGEIQSGATGYEQQLPQFTDDEENPDKVFPYFIVRMGEGVTEDGDDPWNVTISILFGVYDGNIQNMGHRHIMEMIQRTIDRFEAEPLLNKKFRAAEKKEWAMDEEDSYPYYFGGAQMKFAVPKIGRKEPDYE